MKTTKYQCRNCFSQFNTTGLLYEGYGCQKPQAFEKIAVCPICKSNAFEQKERVQKNQLKQYLFLKREIEKEKLRLMRLEKESEEYLELYEIIENNKLRVMALLLKLQSFIYSIDDSCLRQIFEYRYIDGLDWAGVAAKLGGYYSPDYVRIMHDRFLLKQS